MIHCYKLEWYVDWSNYINRINHRQTMLTLFNNGFSVEALMELLKSGMYLAKIGLDNLEEALLLQADMMDLKARIHGPAQAYVMEARLDEGRGPLVTTIVKAGTLFNLLF
ncbi:Translation initiation factor IF-2 [Glycine soja]|uniref:Translation initiation factor IF-2 n=3 Tax=Glycine soja TaxID=3848 RepID=A0A445KM50_GLYSO|nr:Translation initiation factor IF-2 [Glycine soja]